MNGTLRRLTVRAGLCASALCAVQCAEDSIAPPLRRVPDIEYTVAIPSMALDSVHVTVRVNRWPEDTVRFVAPAMYADNPMVPELTPSFRTVRAADSAGDSTEVLLDSVTFGLVRSLRLRIAGAPPLTIDYDVAFVFGPNAGLPVPSIGAFAGYLQGTHLYAAPLMDGDTVLASVWRRPWDMSVAYELGAGVQLRGDKLPAAEPRNVYELLFSTSGLGGVELVRSTAGGQPYRVVNLQDTVYSAAMQFRLGSDLQAISAEVCGLFGTMDWPLSVLLGVNRGGGLEGVYAFSILSPWETDTFGIFNMVAAHEFIHCWVGVRVGDIDMPWWKEGTTNYLGYLAARSSNTCSRALFAWAMTQDLSDSTDVRDYPLSSPRVRTHLFDAGGDMIDLVYVKGSQVCLLMDVAMRQAGGPGLDQLVGEFCRVHDGGSFTRAEYVGFLESRSGVAVAPILGTYADQPGAIPVAVLQQAFAALESLAAFPPDTYTPVALGQRGQTAALRKW
jgi:predicted metalloprotease with PDZ domain